MFEIGPTAAQIEHDRAWRPGTLGVHPDWVRDSVTGQWMSQDRLRNLQRGRLDDAIATARGVVASHRATLKHVAGEIRVRDQRIKQLLIELHTAGPQSSGQVLRRLAQELVNECTNRDHHLSHIAGTNGYLEMARERLSSLESIRKGRTQQIQSEEVVAHG
jgi:hypothetical protein